MIAKLWVSALFWKWTLLVAAILAGIGGIYAKGYLDAKHAAELKAEREKREKIEAALAANEEILRQFAEDQAKDEAADAEREKLLESLLDRLAASGDGSCTLSADDLAGVRKLHGN